ncbi:MAG: ATP-binding protein [Actinomycetes bacterium]
MGQVVVLDVAGRLNDVIVDLDRAIRLALAQEPRGVVCDLSRAVEVSAPGALGKLASAGRHPRDWPGVPVAVTGLDPRAGQTLSGTPLGAHLVVTASPRQALAKVLQTACPAVESRRLAPHPTAPRASRDFVDRTLLDWRLSQHVRDARLVVSELVTNAMTYAGTDIDLTVAAHRQAVRVAVRDRSPALPVASVSGFDTHGRGLIIVAALSSAWGVLPTADGGKVVWAVLDASPRPEHAISSGPTLADVRRDVALR